MTVSERRSGVCLKDFAAGLMPLIGLDLIIERFKDPSCILILTSEVLFLSVVCWKPWHVKNSLKQRQFREVLDRVGVMRLHVRNRAVRASLP